MTVVSDSSPLITLGKIGLLDLLPQLYTTITITPQVYDEVVVNGAKFPGSSQISIAKWIEIKPVKSAADLATSRQRFGLGVGELSVIMLGHEVAADMLLLDDLNARALAKNQGLTFVGCVGVLLSAYRSKLLPDLADAYCRLVSSGAYVDPSLLKNILKMFDLPPL